MDHLLEFKVGVLRASPKRDGYPTLVIAPAFRNFTRPARVG